MKEVFRFIKFGLFSISAGLIEMGVFTLLNEFTNLRYWPCYLIGLVLSVVWNLTLNRKFTFKSDSKISVALLKVFAYYAVFTPVTTILGDYLAETVGVNEYIVTIGSMLLNFVTEFLYQRYFVFRNSVDTVGSGEYERI